MPQQRAGNEEEQRDGDPQEVAVAEGDRRDEERDERGRSPPPSTPAGAGESLRGGTGGRPLGQVGEERVKLTERLRGIAAIQALLELVGIEPSGDVLFAEDVRDRLAVPVTRPETAVARFATILVIGLAIGHLNSLHWLLFAVQSTQEPLIVKYP
jgi:hypothetical protein